MRQQQLAADLSRLKRLDDDTDGVEAPSSHKDTVVRPHNFGELRSQYEGATCRRDHLFDDGDKGACVLRVRELLRRLPART